MYTPPAAKMYQNMFGTNRTNLPPRPTRNQINFINDNRDLPKSDTNIIHSKTPSIKEEKKKTLEEIMEEMKHQPAKTLVIQKTKNIDDVQEETSKNEYDSIHDFWYDIYKTKLDDDQLLLNHKISKDSMIKLLQEQGVISFNPIKYYQNTVQQYEKSRELLVDLFYSDMYSSLLECISHHKNVHTLTDNDFNDILVKLQYLVQNSSLEEQQKIDISNELEVDFLQLKLKDSEKKTEILSKYGFKTSQYVDFCNKFFIHFISGEECKKSKIKETFCKQYITDKVYKQIVCIDLTELKENCKYPEIKYLEGFDKFLKKECKYLSSVPLDEKYFIRFLQFSCVVFILEKEKEKVSKQKTDKKMQRRLQELSIRIEFYTSEREILIGMMLEKIKPFLCKNKKDILTELEHSLELYTFVNLKNKIIHTKEEEIQERYKRQDEDVLKSIKSLNYSNPSILDISKQIHSIKLEINKIPYLLNLFELFTTDLMNEKSSKKILKVYVELYVYIIDYVKNNSVQYEKISQKEKETFEKMKEKSHHYFVKNSIDLYEFQMKHLYEFLPPLSHLDENKPKLDTWQKQVFEMIDHKKNIIVIAPTSSGKTVLSTYCSIISDKLLFVVPSPELSRQVCGMIRNLVIENKLKRNISLVTEKDSYHDCDITKTLNKDISSCFDVLVGTPIALEKFFIEYNIPTDIFDYIVFDEIHQLNQEVTGEELERFIKWFTSSGYSTKKKTNFLALSACVSNAEQLHQWWSQFVGDIELVHYNRRFLQQQKFIWNNQHLIKMNPLSVCTLDFLQNDGFFKIGEKNQIQKVDMAFTPDDLYQLYQKIKLHETFPIHLEPNVFFSSIRLTLDECRQWEVEIKKFLQDLSKTDKDFIIKLLNKYQKELNEHIEQLSIKNLYDLLKNLQANNMLPCILFRLDPNICQQKFIELVSYLVETEQKVFPYYYDDLKFKQERYLEYLEKDKKLETISIPESDVLDKLQMTPELFIEQKKAELREKELSNLQKKYNLLMESRIQYSKNKLLECKESLESIKTKHKETEEKYRVFLSEYEKNKYNLNLNSALLDNVNSEKCRFEKLLESEELEIFHLEEYIEIYPRQIMFYQQEIENIMKLEELSPFNIYKPHPDFTFLENYIDSVHIIEYRKRLIDYLKEEKRNEQKLEKSTIKKNDDDSKYETHENEQQDKSNFRRETYISYDHPFIQGIERGIVLYLNRLPTAFQRVAQSLIASSIKLSPVTFSDHSLAFGINYPIRSVILTGGHIDPIIAHQMIGRAGRRGVDPKGYTIYYDVDWKTIMKETFLDVKGSNHLDPTIWTIPSIWEHIEHKFDLIGVNHLWDLTQSTIDIEDTFQTFLEDIPHIHSIFNREFNLEILEQGVFDDLYRKMYKYKYLGFQSIFILYLLEELSRWKFSFNTLDSSIKSDIVELCIHFYNGNLDNRKYSEHFRSKINNWKDEETIYHKYITKRELEVVRFGEKMDITHIPNWLVVSQIISTLYEITTDWRIKKILISLYIDIKAKIKKYSWSS